MTVLATEAWTGTDGAAWASQWVAGVNSGAATIQSNRGRLLTTGTGYQNIQRFLNVPVAGTCELYVEVTFPTVAESEVYMFVRADSSQTSGYYPTGYGVVFTPATGTYTQEAAYGGGEYMQSSAPVTYTAGATYGVRVRVDGFLVSTKVWNLSGAEPSGWTLTPATDTDSAWPTGRVMLGYHSGNTTNPGVLFDNLTYTDGAATVAPSRAGAMMLAF